MGSKCFRPIDENRQPVYLSSLQKAFDAAHLVDAQKSRQKSKIIQEIMANEQRQGNLKKLFDHLNSHQKNIVPAIKECNKKTTFEKSFAAVVVSNMFCGQLVKMLSDRKSKYSLARSENIIAQSGFILRNLSLTDQFAFRNMIHEIESHFFELVTKIFVYNKQKSIKNSISQTLIQYSGDCDGKITAKKQLKSILDLYLTVVFEKNFQKLDKSSFLPYYAYSTLISKSKSELFTPDFIDKHFNFILKLFFELEDTKASNKSIIESEEFKLFEESIEGIISEFIIFSSSNKKIQDHFFHEIMLVQDAAEFNTQKTKKLENIIFESLDNSTREHFMLDWLGYLIIYISKTIGNGKQAFMDSIAQSLHEINLHNLSADSMKHSFHLQSKTNSIETLKRWFVQNLLNSEKTLQYFSYRIFEALLLNLYNPQQKSSGVTSKSKEVLNYILQRKPKKLSQILIILNKQLRSAKNQYFYSEHHNFSTHGTGGRKALALVQEETAEGLWKNDINFIVHELAISHSEVRLTTDEIQQIYAPVVKANRPSINLLYLIELGAIGLRYSDLLSESVQMSVYSFLLSLTGCLKVPDREIEPEFTNKFTQKCKFLLQQLFSHCEPIIYSFLKYNFKNLFKEDKDDELWTLVLILVILIDIVIHQNKHKSSDRSKNLDNFLEEILGIARMQKIDSRAVYEIYKKNKGLFELSERVSAHLQKIKLKALDQFEMNSESLPISVSNIENSVVSSRLQVSESNPDADFKKIYKMIFKK